MKIVITGGGTGGHIFPALEIAKEFLHHNNAVIFVGNTGGLEETMAKNAGIEFYGLSSRKIVGQSLVKKVLGLCALAAQVFKSMQFLRAHKPDAVVGVGGYVSVPMMVAAFLLGKKRFICEQNVVPGLANRMLARIATAVFVSFKESCAYFPVGKTKLTGNPVRREFFSTMGRGAHDGLRILVTGGSLGARFLNHEAPKAFARIKQACPALIITHQTGKNEVDAVKSAYEQSAVNADVTNFIQDMPTAFRTHDLLVSRAGATVCAEIMASGMPSILVPYPHANAHQKFNAHALSDHGAAITIMESQNFEDHLATAVKDLYSQRGKLHDLGNKAKTMGMADASSMIVQHIVSELN